METRKLRLLISIRLPGAFETSGNPVALRRLLEIIKDEFHIHLVTGERGLRREPVSSIPPGVKTTVIKTKPTTKFLWPIKIIPVIMKRDFDAVLCADDWLGFFTYYAFSKLYHYKMIFYGVNIFSRYLEMPSHWIRKYHWLMKRLEKFVISHSELVLAHAPNFFDFYKRYNENTVMVPLLVDINTFRRQEVEEVSKTRRKIGVVGPFNANRRYVLDFICRNVDRFDRHLDFVAIGECENKIENTRIVYTGYLSHSEYIKQLSQIDAMLAVEPLDYGPFTKILEAMSCSRPVFTTPNGIEGLKGIEPWKDVLVFEENQLVDKVNELVFNRRLMAEIGQNARRFMETLAERNIAREDFVNRLFHTISSGKQKRHL